MASASHARVQAAQIERKARHKAYSCSGSRLLPRLPLCLSRRRDQFERTLESAVSGVSGFQSEGCIPPAHRSASWVCIDVLVFAHSFWRRLVGHWVRRRRGLVSCQTWQYVWVKGGVCVEHLCLSRPRGVYARGAPLGMSRCTAFVPPFGSLANPRKTNIREDSL